jgi:type VI protein secretion system component VasF
VEPTRREVYVWMGGALLVVALVLAWLWFDRPRQDLLPQTYGYGVL